VPPLPSYGTPNYVRLYLEQEQKRFVVLTAELRRHILPEAGSGGVNAKYLYDLSRVQEQAIASWLDADSAGQSTALPDLMRQITVNDNSFDRAIMLFKLLLGREDHNIKNARMLYRKD
jgi:hypothetical protein